MKRLLITGFAPFGGDEVNPSYRAVQALPKTVGQWELYKFELPVTFQGAPKALFSAMDEVEPDAVILVGLAGSRGAVTPEVQAVNLISARIPDNEGRQPQNEPVVAGGPEALCSTLPVEDMAEAIRAAGIPARLSMDAGRFVCNALLYHLLYRLESEDSPVPAAFIHVPYLLEQAQPKGLMGLSLEEITSALRAAIEAI